MSTRGDYKGTWNELASSRTNAFLYVGGTQSEVELDATAIHAVNVLRATAGIQQTDDVLEIGCGVGRVGKGLSPLVRTWTGCDASGRMVALAAERLAPFPNARAIESSGHDLKVFGDASFDVVYATVVFMHLDEWDRYNYVREAFRVLRPNGRFWCDNMNLCTDGGWKIFEDLNAAYRPPERPAHISKSSTPQELEVFLTRAGFAEVRTRARDLWVDAWGRKPA